MTQLREQAQEEDAQFVQTVRLERCKAGQGVKYF